MKRRVSFRTALCLMLAASCATALVLIIILKINGLLVTGNATKWFEKLSEIDHLTGKHYYWEMDDDSLEDSIADGYMRGLGDPYAEYSDGDDTQDHTLSNRGKSVGIGVTVVYDEEEDGLYVYRVDPYAPAADAGLLEKDIILGADGLTVAQDGAKTVYDAIDGEEGTSVELLIKRDGAQQQLCVERRQYELTTAHYRLIGDIGYIDIERFNDLTDDQIIEAIENMRAKGAQGIVFDVRNCGGGVVDPTADILDYLLPEGNIISATYVNGKTQVLHTSDANELDMPMAVLTSGSTASAAELFAAAIRDYGKGVLIGTKTYGKGVMQHTYYLSDGSSVKFTVAEFLPPSGVCFDGVGLEPDIEVTLSDSETKNFYKLTDEQDPQLTAAVNYLHEQTAK